MGEHLFGAFVIRKYFITIAYQLNMRVFHWRGKKTRRYWNWMGDVRFRFLLTTIYWVETYRKNTEALLVASNEMSLASE